MDAIIFDIYLYLEYGDDEHTLTGTLQECGTAVMKVAKKALSHACNYYDQQIRPLTEISAEESDDDTLVHCFG